MCKAFMEQKEIGIKEGMVLGIKQGRAEGFETGRQEGVIETKKEIVRSLYQNNFNIETIMKVTSLTEEEVKRIVYWL